MELGNFIKISLTEIAKGVRDANHELNPDKTSTDYFEVQAHGGKDENYIAFDVAVSSSDKGSVQGAAGIRVLNIGTEVKSGIESHETNVSRIKFFIKVTHNLK